MKPLALLLIASALGAQDTPVTAFEVASVRVSQPEPGRPVAHFCKIDPAIFRCGAATLHTLLTDAYNVQYFQVDGPVWIDREYYDVSAKFPDGATRDKLPQMLERLLAERFALKAHRETRQMPAYELTVAKSGPKLKTVDASKPATEVHAGEIAFRIKPNGAHTMQGNMTMPDMAEFLTRELGRLVVDGTGIAGIFEIDLTYFEEDLRRGTEPVADANTPIATIFQAVQQTLGLHLEPKKAPIEILVVDSANKIPAATSDRCPPVVTRSPAAQIWASPFPPSGAYLQSRPTNYNWPERCITPKARTQDAQDVDETRRAGRSGNGFRRPGPGCCPAQDYSQGRRRAGA